MHASGATTSSQASVATTSSGRPVQLSPSEHVNVQVKYRLPGVGIGVDDRAISARGDALPAGQVSRYQDETAEQRRVGGVVERVDVRPRDDEEVYRRLRIDVTKRDAVVRLGDQRRRNLFPHDTAEEALIGHTSPESTLDTPRRTRPRR